MNYTELILQQCEIARWHPQLSDTHKGTFKHAAWAAADCWHPSDVTRGNGGGGGTATPLLPNSHPHPPSLTYHQINENTEGSQEFPHNSSVTLWTTMKDNPCRSSCLWWECVCLCPARVSVYATTTRLYPVPLPKSQQRSSARKTSTVRHKETTQKLQSLDLPGMIFI